MVSAVVFVPCAPVLVPELSGAAAAELDGLRAAITAAVADLDGPLTLVGPGPATATFGPAAWGTLAPYGRAVPAALDSDHDGAHTGAPTLPPALSVAARLTAAPGIRFDAAVAIGPDLEWSGAAAVLRERCAAGGSLVVAGDGSARRTDSAPGYLDERAAGYDAAAVAALASGDPRALAALDLALGAELLAAGPPVWVAVARALSARTSTGPSTGPSTGRSAGSPFRASVDYDDAPYGVGYVVARWTRPS